MKVSILIPNWNGQKQLSKNLKSVLAANTYEVIIVDDASTDNSIEYLKSNYPEVKIVKNSSNMNFAYTVNKGITLARGELVCIINVDVLPLNGFIQNSIKYFSDPKLFGVSLHELGYGPALSVFENGFIGYKGGEEINAKQSTFWLSGGSCIIRRSLWTNLGGFDWQLFPYYWEDLDLSYRAVKRGYRLLWIHDCKVEHHHETSYRNKYSLTKLNREKEIRQLTFIWKNITEKSLIVAHILGLIKRMVKSPGYIKIILLTLFKFPLIMKMRTKENKYSQLTDTEVLNISRKGIL